MCSNCPIDDEVVERCFNLMTDYCCQDISKLGAQESSKFPDLCKFFFIPTIEQKTQNVHLKGKSCGIFDSTTLSKHALNLLRNGALRG